MKRIIALFTICRMAILKHMDEQLRSNHPASWLEVAKCEFATENHLLGVAKKCATINRYITNLADKEKQIEIANALSENLATTDAVMAELFNSRFPDVQSIGHKWIEN